MSKKDLTISIVTYNNEQLIRDTIDNVLKNIPDYIDFHIYIVDNNSIDKTREIITSVNSEKISCILLDKNIGFGSAHNKAIKIVESRYHLIMNPDIKLGNNEVIPKMIEFLDKNTDIGLAMPVVRFPDGTRQNLCRKNPTVFDLFARLTGLKIFKKKYNSHNMLDYNYNTIFDVEFLSGCFMFCRTNILKEVGGFDERYFLYMEDADLTRSIKKLSRTVYVPIEYVEHKWERGDRKNIKLFFIHVISAVKYFIKWIFFK